MAGYALNTRRRLYAVTACMGVVLAGCQSSNTAPKPQSIRISDDVFVQPVTAGVWVHTTYHDVPGYGRTPANGLIVVDGKEAMLIDLPWTDEQTATLFDWIAANQGAVVKTVVPTHFHQDCMGGLAEAHRRRATSYGLDKTIEIARQRRLPVPQIPFQLRTMVRCGPTVALVTYYGPGHTTDNVVAWLPKQGILFGGCLIKSMDAQSLGNTADGDLTAYPITLRKVQAAYRHAKIVVPGHGDWGGPELIEHTLGLCAPAKTKP
ncbi:MAG: subclass B1 metallo-beta-lactamase [Phycisphaerales bacterium]